ncbi:hypothetical protein M0812_11989 [Anaeramoeba flamelloides]|uniref:B box-type domain-containing protein n=1 Tax=Anaeramoeba flamelloides TaxID=1746091 RepID=A0AAV7ZJS2_9EUKA|nr:hypothetical protein M0812_11989 [Anaeramoeba flamelloides]
MSKKDTFPPTGFQQLYSENEIQPDISVSDLCENCLEEKKEVASKFFCLSCKMSFCEECNKTAHTLSVLKKHQRIKIKKGTLEKEEGSLERFCYKHNKNLRVFCFNCEQLICTNCAFSNHEDHEIKTIDIASKQYKLKNLDAVPQTLKRKEDFVTKVQQEKEMITQKLDQRLKDLDEKRDLLIKKIEQVVHNLKETITDEEMKKLKLLFEQEQKEKRNVGLLKTAEKNLSRLQSAQRRKDHLEILGYSVLFNHASDISVKSKKETLAAVSGPQKKLSIATQIESLMKMDFVTPFDISKCKIGINSKFGSIGDMMTITLTISNTNYQPSDYVPALIQCHVTEQKNNSEMVVTNFVRKQDFQGIFMCTFKPKAVSKYNVTKIVIDGEIILVNEINFEITAYSNCWNPNKKGERIALSNGNRSARFIGGSGRGKDRQIEGVQIMTSGVHTFRLKIDKLSGCMELGVKPPLKKGWVYKVGWTFCLDCAEKHSLGASYRFGKKCKTGDVITMIIDMDKHTLSYKLNDINLGVSSKNISKEVVIAVGIWGINNQISFL